MTDEEKKAINIIKSLGISIYDGKSQIISGTETKEINTAIYTTLNLIEKQSKEIEELKEDSCCMTNCVRRDKEKLFLQDKIKAKIEELENEYTGCTTNVFSVLQSLLEEE